MDAVIIVVQKGEGDQKKVLTLVSKFLYIESLIYTCEFPLST
jgi:hypothetical protein